MSESAAPPKFTLLYAILTPVIILPVLVILILFIRGDRASQLYNRGLELTTEKKYNEAAQAFREAGFDIGRTQSPIIPLFVRDTERLLLS